MAKIKISIKLKNILLALFIVTALVSGHFTNILHYATSVVKAEYDENKTSLISNYNFSTPSSGVLPAPSSWTFKEPNNTDDSVDSKTLKHGIINVYDSQFDGNKEEYELESNPHTPTPATNQTESDPFFKHLMINSYNNNPARAYYESNQVTLDKASFYIFEVVAFTQSGGTTGSIHLSGLSDDEVISGVYSFRTEGLWQTYRILVSTSEFVSESVTLQLWLGGQNDDSATSKGAIFFNEVSLRQYSNSSYDIEVLNAINDDTQTQKHIVINLKEQKQLAFPNADFNTNNNTDPANDIAGYKTLKKGDHSVLKTVSTQSFNESGLINPGSNYQTNNYNILLMRNTKADTLGIQSPAISIAKQGFYKLDFWAKSTSASNISPKAILIEYLEDAEGEEIESSITPVEVSITTSTESANAKTNGWKNYSFVIEGSSKGEKFVKLQFWLGTESQKAEGFVYFDEISLQAITYSQYNSSSDTKLSLANTSSAQLANGNFELTSNVTNDISYPLTPRNWTYTTSVDDQDQEDSKSGVISTTPSEFDLFASSFTRPEEVVNPGLTPLLTQVHTNTVSNTPNNLLVIANENNVTQAFTSSTVSMSSSSYYKVSFDVFTSLKLNSNNSHLGANVKVDSSNYTLWQLNGIQTNGEWKTVAIHIKTGNTTLTSSIELALSDIQGFVYFDNVEIESSTETIFNNTTQNPSILKYKVDLSRETFSLYNSNSTTAINTPFNWQQSTTNASQNAQWGVVNTSSQTFNSEMLGLTNPGKATSNSSGNALYIASKFNGVYHSVVSKDTITLASGTYYKVSVWVKTQNLYQDPNDIKYYKDSDNNNVAYPYGASIKLTTFDKYFNGITTTEWSEYVFYVSPDQTTTVNIELSLGSANALTRGIVYFETIKVSTIDKTEYIEQTTNIASFDNKLLLTEISADEPIEEPTEDKDFEPADFNWLLVSSILTSLAILIAMAGTLLRKIKITRKPRIKTSYDRRKTVEVHMNKRERIDYKHKVISNLKDEYAEIEKEIIEYLQELDKEEALIKEEVENKKQHYNSIKQAIIAEINTAKEQHNDAIKNVKSPQEKEKTEKEFAKLISNLTKKQINAEQKENEKELRFETLQTKRERYLERQNFKKKLIEDEIARIEREIEEIAQEEEQMWSEYRKAKEEAKKLKAEYKQQKQAQKRNTMTSKEKQEQNKTDNSNLEVDSDASAVVDADVEVEQNASITPPDIIEVEIPDNVSNDETSDN